MFPEGAGPAFGSDSVTQGGQPLQKGKNIMKMKCKLALVLAKAFSGKSAPERKLEKEARASEKLKDWLKSSRMRSF